MSCNERTAMQKIPYFDRVSYFHGQMLGVREFQTEQAYFREKLRLHNRCLHGYGVVCGLEVIPVPVAGAPCDDDPVPPAETPKPNPKPGEGPKTAARSPKTTPIRRTDLTRKCPAVLRISPGVALDCEGNELVVRHDNFDVDLLAALGPGDRRKLAEDEVTTLYVWLCYCERPIEPARPVVVDTCDAFTDCRFGKVRDSVSVKVSTEPPEEDTRCEPCCGACRECCVLLARIDDFSLESPIPPSAVDNSVRRELALYVPTRVTGISWTHAATYTKSETDQLLGTEGGGGVEIQFSREVLVSSLTPGVVDLWVIEGGAGPSASIYSLAGELVGLPEVVTGDETVSKIVYRQTTGQNLQNGDRVLITVRTSFVLDRCCRPVDGEHVGGRVPILDDYKDFDRGTARVGRRCERPVPPTSPWRSGDGTPGGTFESWWYVTNDVSQHKHAQKPVADRAR